MDERVKRVYLSANRAESAQHTRASIRTAARELFVELGFAATTMHGVARRSGVAERTVYAAFSSKTALFRDVLDHAAIGQGAQVTAADEPELLVALTRRDLATASEVIARTATALCERVGDLIMTMVESSGADPDMREMVEWGFRQSHSDARRVTDLLDAHEALRSSLSPATATDLLHTLCSPQTHQLLRRRDGWSASDYQAWLTDVLARTIIAER
jgi:AcrR family transcriptional regulator